MSRKPIYEELEQKVEEWKKAVVEQQKPEEKLSLFRSIVESSSEAIAVSDSNGQLIYINPAHERLFGLPIEKAKQLNYRDYYPQESIEILNRDVAPCLERGESWEGVLDVIDSDGRRFPLWERADTIRDSKGGMLFAFGLMHDISEFQQLEQALRKVCDEKDQHLVERTSVLETVKEYLREEGDIRRRVEEAYRILVDYSLQGLAVLQDARIVFANKMFAETTGYTTDELLKFSPEEVQALVHPEDRKLVFGRLQARLEGKSVPDQYEFRFTDKDGIVRWVEVCASLTEFNGRPAVQAAYIDITDRKRAEQFLLEKERELEKQTQHLQELNAALKVLLQYREEERERLEAYILKNVEELIYPYIEKLEKGGLDMRDSQFLSIIKTNIENLVSPFAKTLSSKYSHLTPTETQIAALVKQGKTSKEIASLLDVSSKAIEFHRSNIRVKLGLHDKKTNLRSFLASVNE